jgi:hypothetical protein
MHFALVINVNLCMVVEHRIYQEFNSLIYNILLVENYQ